MSSGNFILDTWNALPAETAARVMLPFNGSAAWATGVANLRPFGAPAALLAASDTVWRALDEDAWKQAFDSHPRIGERHAKAATAESLVLSGAEQAAATFDGPTQEALASANVAYEAKFGRIFIVCASGKTAAEMLAILLERMKNEPGEELLAAAEEQRRITELRLRGWLNLQKA